MVPIAIKEEALRTSRGTHHSLYLHEAVLLQSNLVLRGKPLLPRLGLDVALLQHTGAKAIASAYTGRCSHSCPPQFPSHLFAMEVPFGTPTQTAPSHTRHHAQQHDTHTPRTKHTNTHTRAHTHARTHTCAHARRRRLTNPLVDMAHHLVPQLEQYNRTRPHAYMIYFLLSLDFCCSTNLLITHSRRIYYSRSIISPPSPQHATQESP